MLLTALQAKLELMEDERTRAAEEAGEAAEEAQQWRQKCQDLQVRVCHTAGRRGDCYFLALTCISTGPAKGNHQVSSHEAFAREPTCTGAL